MPRIRRCALAHNCRILLRCVTAFFLSYRTMFPYFSLRLTQIVPNIHHPFHTPTIPFRWIFYIFDWEKITSLHAPFFLFPFLKWVPSKCVQSCVFDDHPDNAQKRAKCLFCKTFIFSCTQWAICQGVQFLIFNWILCFHQRLVFGFIKTHGKIVLDTMPVNFNQINVLIMFRLFRHTVF